MTHVDICVSVTKLLEHWDETNSKVMQRKTQLDAMLGDSQRYEAKRNEVENWLDRKETRLARMRSVGHTADVLEAQLREQKVLFRHADLCPIPWFIFVSIIWLRSMLRTKIIFTPSHSRMFRFSLFMPNSISTNIKSICSISSPKNSSPSINRTTRPGWRKWQKLSISVTTISIRGELLNWFIRTR